MAKPVICLSGKETAEEELGSHIGHQVSVTARQLPF